MTQTPTLVQSGPSKTIVRTARPTPSNIQREAAATACARFFAKTAALRPFGADDRRAVVDAVVEVLSVGSEQPVPLRGRPSAHLYLLVEGWALRSHTLPDGARQITDIALPGDLCDWAFMASQDRGQGVHACGPARVAVLRNDAAGGPGSSALWRSWEWAREAEARILRSRLVSLGRRESRARLAHLMSELHSRLDRVGLANGGVFECPLTQEQLGDVLGLSLVHVNRVLQALRREGLLAFNRRQVAIPDLARLHAAASFYEGPTM